MVCVQILLYFLQIILNLATNRDLLTSQISTISPPPLFFKQAMTPILYLGQESEAHHEFGPLENTVVRGHSHPQILTWCPWLLLHIQQRSQVVATDTL